MRGAALRRRGGARARGRTRVLPYAGDPRPVSHSKWPVGHLESISARHIRKKLNTVFNNSVSDDVIDILTERLSKNQHLSDVPKKKVKTNQDKLEPLLRKEGR